MVDWLMLACEAKPRLVARAARYGARRALRPLRAS
jgi:hypothetical protein